MLHSLLLLNDDNYVLLARYFDPAVSVDARKRYETQLARICAQQLPQLWTHKPSQSTASSATTNEPQLVVCENQYVLLRSVGELRVVLSGSHEYDELVLAEILALVHAVLVTQLEKKLTETSLLANYAKIVAAIDEMVQHGHLETADENAIEQMSKLKPFPVK